MLYFYEPGERNELNIAKLYVIKILGEKRTL